MTTAIDIELLETSLELVKARAGDFLESFYQNLFTDYPLTQTLFEHSDMKKQKIMLLNLLAFTVSNLRSPERLDETLRNLGDRHVGYGAIAEYYDFFGQSLLKTFAQYLGPQWTPETQRAWQQAYEAIYTRMLPR